ncbi:MAG: sensor domain-containing diguanylate cyclase [Rhodospirillaceae bacterium]
MKRMIANHLGQQRFVLITAALLVVGFLATSLASYFVSVTKVRGLIMTDELPLTSDNIYTEIQKDLVRPVLVSAMMASDTFLRDWVIDGEQDTDPIVKYLTDVMARNDAISAFFISEQTKNYYHPKGIVQQVSEDDPDDIWYFRARDMSLPYEINVDTDQANARQLTIFINYRVLDYEGDFLGIAGVGLQVDTVQQEIQGYQDRFDRNVYFLDIGGNPVLTGDKGIGSQEGLDTVRDQIIVNDAGSFEYQANGETYLLSTRFVQELSWFLVVEQAEGATLTGLRQTLYLNIGICILISVAILLIFTRVLRNHQSKLLTMATTDKLTGLLNRQAFEAIFETEIANVRRSGEPLSILLFDVDDFKRVNDHFGHLGGDEVIRRVADQTATAVREADNVCRWGGEEYIVLLRRCGLEDAGEIAEKIRLRIAEGAGEKSSSVAGDTPESVTVTVSLGGAQFQDGDTRESLVSRADEALYRAKRSGKNRAVMAEGTILPMDPTAASRRA